jgi:glycosyltransferase involved in cell wall biosynthesis
MPKESIRILYITNPLSIHARRWIKAFTDRGYDVHLLSPVPWKEEGVKTHVLPLYPEGVKNPVSRSLRGLKNVRKGRRFIRSIRPQVLHLHGLFTVFGPDLMFVVFRQKNLVVSTWGSDILYPLEGREPLVSRLIKRSILRQAHTILATSYFQAGITQQYSPKGKAVFITPFGADLSLFKKDPGAKKDPAVFTLCFVKRLERNYGPHVLLEAFKLVENKHSNIRLWFIGDGSMKEPLKKRAKEIGISSKVHFLGQIENDQIPSYLNQTDIFVMPSFRETFGVAAIEAQAVQVPVVASDIEGIREVVLHGKTGYLASPGNDEQFASWIMKLIEDPQSREKMGLEGRKFVSDRYDWQKCVDQMENIYFALLRRPECSCSNAGTMSQK